MRSLYFAWLTLFLVSVCFAFAETDSLPVIVVVTTGGTIAEKFDRSFRVKRELDRRH